MRLAPLHRHRLLLALSIIPTLASAQLAVKIACLQAGYTECICTCVSPLLLAYCALNTGLCACTNTSYLSAATSCMVASCPSGEVQSARGKAEQECVGLGVSLPANAYAASGGKATSAAASSAGSTGTVAPGSASYDDTGHAMPASGDKKKSGLGTGAIVGIVVGVVGGFAVGAYLMYFLLRRGRRSQASPPPVAAAAAAAASPPVEQVKVEPGKTEPPYYAAPAAGGKTGAETPPHAVVPELYQSRYVPGPSPQPPQSAQPPQYRQDGGGGGEGTYEMPGR